MILIPVLIGLILLFTGRRLFWLFVACVGFAGGYHVAQQVLAVDSLMVVMALSIAAGLLGAVIAVFFQKAAVVLAGFGAGSYAMISFFSRFSDWPPQVAWLSVVAGGIAGAVILFLLFDWALIFLSALTGATLIVQTVAFSPWIELALFLFLFGAGIAIQTRIAAREKQHPRPERPEES